MAGAGFAAVMAVLGLAGADESVAGRLRRAKELVDRGDPGQAAAIYRGLARAYPREPEFLLDAAIAEYKAGLYAEAAADSRAALKLDARLYPAWLFLGASHLELGEAKQALEPLRTAAAALPNDRNARVLLAGALLALERYSEAAREYEALAEALPEGPGIWYGLGRSRDGMARELRQRLQRQAPGTVYALAAAAEYETARGQFGKALALFREALRADPSAKWLHAAVAELYQQAGHSGWAALERAKAAGQPEAGGLFGQARQAAALAAAAYARLNELPDSPEKHEHAADAREQQAQFRAAAAELRAALRLSPNRRKLQWRLGLALLNSHDYTAAVAILERLLKAQPDSAELNFLCGSALLNMQQTERALPYLETAVRLDPTHAPARGALGQAYLEADRARDALPMLEAALGGDDRNGTRHYQLARAYQAAGLRERAAAARGAYAEWIARAGHEETSDPPITPP